MAQRERLIELLGECRHIDGLGMELAEKQADCLLANGVIVPPCKVGDTVWVRWSYTNAVKKNIYPVKVYALRFDTKKNNMRICVEGQFEITAYGGSFTHYYCGTFSWDSVGKTVFLAREEAEKALAKRSGE
jgi:hypothetical protein